MDIQKFNISVGKSRKDKRWRNQEWTWEQFCTKISKPHITAETVAEYMTLSETKEGQERQAEIKDIGGFVGGSIIGGRRLAHSVISRSMITLDADNAKPDFWEVYLKRYKGFAAALYSTHKHTAALPRYRLVIPLSREVIGEEYTAICRKIASNIGIDQFDPTGYQIHRLMYWPSVSKDGLYEYKEEKGMFLNPDTILKGEYINWQDISEWPVGSSEKKDLEHRAKKQGDPLEKSGLIGAFCRVYDIHKAIDVYLQGVYEKTSRSDRYTFVGGSTSAGVIVYDDKFSYSHHSTDPASMVLCNSFDLIRLHKFGLLDDETADNVPINKRPSYLAMCDFASKDSDVIIQIGRDKLNSVNDAFSEVSTTMEVGKTGEIVIKDDGKNESNDAYSDEWLKRLDVDRKGNLEPSINNYALILENDPNINIKLDSFRNVALFNKPPKMWARFSNKPDINDYDLSQLENYIEKTYKIVNSSKFQKGLQIALSNKAFHPVADYLNNLKWDGISRLETLFIDYLGAADTEYTRAVTVKSLTAAVARIFKPGCKYDTIVTFIGKEGQGKSSLLEALGQKWFNDTFSLHMLQNKEGYEQMQGSWIIEIQELAGMAKVEVERVKGFISSRKDKFRAAFGKITEEKDRQCVFFAGTNSWDFLKSQTGNRRFWPVVTHAQPPKLSVFDDLTKQVVNQIWAEAVERYKKGEQLYLSGAVKQIAELIQEEHTEENPLVGAIINYLDYEIPANWYDLDRWAKLDYINRYEEEKTKQATRKRTKICAPEIWEIVMNQKDTMSLYDLKNIKSAMDKVRGWERVNSAVRFGKSYLVQKCNWQLVEVESKKLM